MENNEILYTKRGDIRKRKPKKEQNYFTKETEDAIVAYNLTSDSDIRNKIYEKSINSAFFKLSENIINNFNFDYRDEPILDKIHELNIFMLSKIHLYNPDRGKAYSYFGTMIKRYMIIDNKKSYDKAKNRVEINSTEEIEGNKSYMLEIVNDQLNEVNSYNFFIKYLDYVDNNLEKIFVKEKDLKVADAVLELFRKRESLEVFNKKALYIYVKEMIDTTTPQITKIVKVLKEIYTKMFNKYYREGIV